MTRRSRVFKLRLSPAGMDLLISSHCHLIQSTRALLAWGTTLHVAVEHLDRAPASDLFELFEPKACAPFLGNEEHHLGALKGVNEIAARIAARVCDRSSHAASPMISIVYIVALQHLRTADPETLKAAWMAVRGQRENI
ncbi:hypothetical protein AB2M62_03450 [Sphingomonas sp. MMS12-HWE2-04]|uniref:hypothetical protein n=1 Tax=Sphingomonas sp. MMS12-HWE2-04 TaxID=3234199 RepID=UPI00384B5FB3